MSWLILSNFGDKLKQPHLCQERAFSSFKAEICFVHTIENVSLTQQQLQELQVITFKVVQNVFSKAEPNLMFSQNKGSQDRKFRQKKFHNEEEQRQETFLERQRKLVGFATWTTSCRTTLLFDAGRFWSASAAEVAWLASCLGWKTGLN